MSGEFTLQFDAFWVTQNKHAIQLLFKGARSSLSTVQLKRLLRTSIRNGDVDQALSLLRLLKTKGSAEQGGVLIRRCLSSGDVGGAVRVARKIRVSAAMRKQLADALVFFGVVDNMQKAEALLAHR